MFQTPLKTLLLSRCAAMPAEPHSEPFPNQMVWNWRILASLAFAVKKLRRRVLEGFWNRSGPRASEGSSDRCQLNCLRCCKHFNSKLRITIKNHVLVRMVIGECFAKLLRDPYTVRMSGDIEVQNAPTIMSDHKEAR